MVSNRTIALGLLGLAVILLGSTAYALTQLSVSNNVTITPGVGIGVATFTSNPTTCPALGNTAYGTVTPLTNTIAWSIPAGGSQTQFFCIENQGSGNDAAPSIVISSIPATITCTTAPCLSLTTNPTAILALPAQTVSAPVSVTLTATASTSGSGTVSITVS
jgi:hypothetical protein